MTEAGPGLHRHGSQNGRGPARRAGLTVSKGENLKRSGGMVAAGLRATILAGPASAKGPIIEPLPGDDFVIPAGGACSFPMSVDFP
jgi:hypothetical protein